MSNICAICDKGPRAGNRVSNANNKVGRWVYPNVHVIRYKIKGQVNVFRNSVCAKCLKSGKVEKVI